MKFVANPQFINNENGEYNLFVVDYVPAEQKNEVFIILNPLGSECNVIDALLVNLARHLASIGSRVIRFDYFGTRDSDGDFKSVTLNTLLSDIETVVEFSSRDNDDSPPINLIGVRFGTLLAMQFVETHNDLINSLILCAPVVSASDYISSELMQALSMQTVLFKKIVWDRKRIIHELVGGNSTIVEGYNLANMNGYPLTKELYLSLIELDQLLNSHSVFTKKCLIINIDSRKRKVYKTIEALTGQFDKAQVEHVELIATQGLPWIHGKTLQKIYYQLNEKIATWINSDG